jgi:chromosome segregation ATPase
MKKTHRLTVIVAMAVLAAAWGPLCGNAAADDGKPVSVPVRITHAEGKEGGARLMQLLQAPDTFFGRELRVEITPNLQDAGGTTLLGFLQMRIPPGMTEKAAFENLKAGLKRLETVLRTEQEKDHRKLLDMLQAFEANIEENRTRLRALQHDMPPDPSAKLSEINKAVEGLRGQIRESEIQNVAKEARLKATEEELAKLDAPRVREHPLVKELTKVVELCEKQLQTVKERVAQGKASQDDLEKATLKLTEANVELTRARGMGFVLDSHSPEFIAKLRGEATTLVIDLKELAARREAAMVQLSKAEAQQVDLLKTQKEFQVWRLVSEYETSLTKRELERAQARTLEVLEQFRAQEFAQPTVTIVDPAELDGVKGDKTQPAPKGR